MYAQLAQTLFFQGTGRSSFVTLAGSYGLEFRKGKTVEDVVKAMKKARDVRNGRAKTEVEIGMLEVYLQAILKPIKGEKK